MTGRRRVTRRVSVSGKRPSVGVAAGTGIEPPGGGVQLLHESPGRDMAAGRTDDPLPAARKGRRKTKRKGKKSGAGSKSTRSQDRSPRMRSTSPRSGPPGTPLSATNSSSPANAATTPMSAARTTPRSPSPVIGSASRELGSFTGTAIRRGLETPGHEYAVKDVRSRRSARFSSSPRDGPGSYWGVTSAQAARSPALVSYDPHKEVCLPRAPSPVIPRGNGSVFELSSETPPAAAYDVEKGIRLLSVRPSSPAHRFSTSPRFKTPPRTFEQTPPVTRYCPSPDPVRPKSPTPRWGRSPTGRSGSEFKASPGPTATTYSPDPLKLRRKSSSAIIPPPPSREPKAPSGPSPTSYHPDPSKVHRKSSSAIICPPHAYQEVPDRQGASTSTSSSSRTQHQNQH